MGQKTKNNDLKAAETAGKWSASTHLVIWATVDIKILIIAASNLPNNKHVDYKRARGGKTKYLEGSLRIYSCTFHLRYV